MKTNEKPIIIIGAGLSGLACAKTLQDQNRHYLLFEQSSEVGGRIKTMSTSDGYKLDHGFQVLLTSYPELKNFIDLKTLDLKLFNSGSLIYNGQKTQLLANPILHPSRLIAEMISNFPSFKDKILVLKLLIQINLPFGKKDLKNITTLTYLVDFGFSQKFIDLFWQPFLTGVFLDTELSTNADFFIFLMKGFSSGRVAVPAKGMQEIPKQIAGHLNSQNIRFNTSIKEFGSNYVITDGGEKITASHVVSTSNPQKNDQFYNSVQNLYFTTSENLNWGSWLVIVPVKLNLSVSTIAVMNHVSKDYGTKDSESLLSVSIIGLDDVPVGIIENEIRQISNLPLRDLKLVYKFVIQKALPKMNQTTDDNFLIKDGIYHCGDWAASPSINGALKSGRCAAEDIISKL